MASWPRSGVEDYVTDWTVLYLPGKLSSDSVSNHQVSRGAASPNGNVFTSQFGTSAAGTPLRGTISIKLSSQSSTATALRGNNAVSSLAAADAGDNEETNSSPRRTSLVSSADSSSQVAVMWCTLSVELTAGVGLIRHDVQKVLTTVCPHHHQTAT